MHARAVQEHQKEGRGDITAAGAGWQRWRGECRADGVRARAGPGARGAQQAEGL